MDCGSVISAGVPMERNTSLFCKSNTKKARDVNSIELGKWYGKLSSDVSYSSLSILDFKNPGIANETKEPNFSPWEQSQSFISVQYVDYREEIFRLKSCRKEVNAKP